MAPRVPPVTTSSGGMDAGLDPRLRHEQRHDERERGDEEAVLRAVERERDRHPAGERDRRVPGRPAAPQRRAAARQRLHRDHEHDDEHERDERQLGGRLREPVEEPFERSATWPENTR